MTDFTEPGRYITDAELDSILEEKFKSLTSYDVSINEILKNLYSKAIDDFEISKNIDPSLCLVLKVNNYDISLGKNLNVNVKASYNLNNILSINYNDVNSFFISTDSAISTFSDSSGTINFKFLKDFPNCSNLNITMNHINYLDFSNFKGEKLTSLIFTKGKKSPNQTLEMDNFTGNILKTLQICNTFDKIIMPKFTAEDLSTFSIPKTLKELNFSNFIGSNITDLSYSFKWLSGLKELNLPEFLGSSVLNMSDTFYGVDCSIINLPKFTGESLTNMSSTFYTAKTIELNLPLLTCNNLTSLAYTFYGMHNIIELNLPNFIGNNIKELSQCFCQNEKLISISMPKFIGSNLSSSYNIFSNDSSLMTIHWDSFIGSSNFKFGSYDFTNCYSLKDIFVSSNINAVTLTGLKEKIYSINPGVLTLHVGDASYQYKNNTWSKV